MTEQNWQIIRCEHLDRDNDTSPESGVNIHSRRLQFEIGNSRSVVLCSQCTLAVLGLITERTIQDYLVRQSRPDVLIVPYVDIKPENLSLRPIFEDGHSKNFAALMRKWVADALDSATQ